MGRPLMTCVGCADNRSHLASRHLLQVLLAISLFVAAAGPGVGSEEPSSSRPPAQPASPAAQIPHTPSPVRPPSSVACPSPRSTPSSQATPSPQPTPFAVPSLPGPSPVPSNTQRPAVSPSPPVSLTIQSAQSLNPLTLDEALRLATAQASSFQTATLNERIAAEDVKQAQAAFLPRVSAPLSYIYTSPALGLPPGEPRLPSFIANNAVNEYSPLVNVAGDLDIAGRLRA